MNKYKTLILKIKYDIFVKTKNNDKNTRTKSKK